MSVARVHVSVSSDAPATRAPTLLHFSFWDPTSCRARTGVVVGVRHYFVPMPPVSFNMVAAQAWDGGAERRVTEQSQGAFGVKR